MKFVEKHIDLTQYGGEGEIVIGPQSLRSRAKMGNEISKRTVSVTKVGDDLVMEPIEGINTIDCSWIQLLSYVRKAPFETDLEAFYAFCDKLEENCPGSTVKLEEELKAAVEEVSSEPSPLDS